jgi:hypothetical protein
MRNGSQRKVNVFTAWPIIRHLLAPDGFMS